MTGKVADKVLEHYPEISRAWLLSGEGDMIANIGGNNSGVVQSTAGGDIIVGVPQQNNNKFLINKTTLIYLNQQWRKRA